MADPVTATAVFAFINSAFKLSEYAQRLYAVGSENGVFVRLIHRVRLDLEETERLLCVPSVKNQLNSTPAKLPWINGAILNAKAVLNDIGRWVDRVRADQEGYGRVSWENRVRWVFNDRDKLLHQQMELGMSHQALSTVLAYLAPLEQPEPAEPAEPVVEDEAPPPYDDATFFDDFLSPAQRRRKRAQDGERSIGAERRDEETLTERESRPTQVRSAVSFTSQTTAETEAGSSGDIIPSASTTSSHTSNQPSSSPRSTVTGSWSVSSAPLATVESNPSPNSPPISLSSGHATPQWPCRSDQARPPMPPSTSVSTVLRQSRSPMTRLPSVSSWAQANSLGYGERADIPVPLTSTSSWPVTGPGQSMWAAQQSDRIISPRSLESYNHDTSPRPFSSTSLLPAFQTQTPQVLQPFRGPNTGAFGSHPRNTASNRSTSATMPPGSSQPPQQISATNVLGPIDPYELYIGSDARSSSIRSEVVHPHVVSSSFANPRPMSPRELPLSQETYQSSAQMDTKARRMSKVLIQHLENYISPAEMSQDTTLAPASAIELPAEYNQAVEKSQSPRRSYIDAPIPTYTETPSQAFSEVPRADRPYPPSTASWPSAQLETYSQLEPYDQSHDQTYRPSIPINSSYTGSSDLTSTAAPSPSSWQEQQRKQTRLSPVSPPTQEAITTTTDQTAASAIQDERPSLPKSTTLREARRRNQKALLDLMERGDYG